MSMTHDQIDRCDALWRELADTSRVRWMPGMLARNTADADHPLQRILRRSGAGDTRVWCPVWTDPATIGCLVAMAREAVGHSAIACWRSSMTGEWGVHNTDRPFFRETEPEAMLLAIQAATA